MIRKATSADLPAVAALYAHIHEAEQTGRMTIGWVPGVYPVPATAETALARGVLFVDEEDGVLRAAGIIDQVQVDVYADGRWTVPAADEQVMVLHTLVVEPSITRGGIGRAFVAFYEDQARRHGCIALRLDTNERNAAARAMYARLGYHECGIVPCDFNGIPDIRLVLLEKAL